MFGKLLAIVLTLGLALAQPDPLALLKASIDSLRGPAMSAKFEITIDRPGRTRRYVLQTLGDGGDRSLLRVLEPARYRGQAFLVKGNQIWIYDPRFRRTLSLPPSGKSGAFLGSDLSYQDFAGRDFERDYEVSIDSKTPETITLRLVPKPRAPVPYGSLLLSIDATTNVPKVLTYYDQRDKAIKQILFLQADPIGNGRFLVIQGEVKDLLKPERRTQFRVLEYQIGPVPDRCFTLNALEEGCP